MSQTVGHDLLTKQQIISKLQGEALTSPILHLFLLFPKLRILALNDKENDRAGRAELQTCTVISVQLKASGHLEPLFSGMQSTGLLLEFGAWLGMRDRGWILKVGRSGGALYFSNLLASRMTDTSLFTVL